MFGEPVDVAFIIAHGKRLNEARAEEEIPFKMEIAIFQAVREKPDRVAGPYSADLGVIVCCKESPKAEGLRNLAVQHNNPTLGVWVKRSEFEAFARDMIDGIEEFDEKLSEGLRVFRVGVQAGKRIPWTTNN
jgi:hypothetical protein